MSVGPKKALNMSFVFSHNITREGSLHKDDMVDNNNAMANMVSNRKTVLV